MKLGAQLYTLREFTQNERDLGYTLEKVRKIGYTEVQVSAIGPIQPKIVKHLCDENGLKIAITHTNTDRIMNETEAVIEEHNIMDCDYIGIGFLPNRYHSEEWLPHFAIDFMGPAQQIAAAGKLLMYHNHAFEFEKFGKKRLLDTLINSFTAKELGFTFDTYWGQAAGNNPVQIIEKLKNRIPCVHLKDMDVVDGKPVMSPVLEGNMDFKSILAALENDHSTEHLLVEQDTCLESPFVCLEKSYKNLSALGYE